MPSELEQFKSDSTLSAIIGDHIVSGQAIDYDYLKGLSTLEMLSGNNLTISSGDLLLVETVVVENVVVGMGTDETFDNGILYGITDVIVFGTAIDMNGSGGGDTGDPFDSNDPDLID